MTILISILTVVLTYSTRTIRTVSSASHWNQALMAADSGVADYLARLNANDNYWLTTDCSNTAMQAPTTPVVCGWGAGTSIGWLLLVPGGEGAQFHYEVSNTATPVSGTIVLTSTGRMVGETRTVQVRLRRGGFGEFLYYTVYETIDPADESEYGLNNTDAQAKCSQYYWAGRSAYAPSPCSTSTSSPAT